jgi:hypothetical protein
MVEVTHLLSWILILAASLIPICLSFKLKNELRVLTSLLAVFLLSHSAYHALCVIGYESIGEKILEPISVIMLIIFGIAYFRIRKRKEVEAW